MLDIPPLGDNQSGILEIIQGLLNIEAVGKMPSTKGKHFNQEFININIRTKIYMCEARDIRNAK